MLRVTHESQNARYGMFSILMNIFLPYWPLFLLLSIFSILGAFAYLFYVPPTYEVTATLLIKDEKRGVDDPRMTEAINMFNSKKIVENEIEVIGSRFLMREVVNDLDLYAPIFEEDNYKVSSAYVTSPILIKHKSPENLREVSKIYFSYTEADRSINIDGANYPINKWVDTPYGTMLFYQNPNQNSSPTLPLYFSLIQPKKVTAELLEDLSIAATSKLSTVINLTFKDQDPKRGENVLNRLIYFYNQASIADRNILASNTMSFIEERMQLVEKELKGVENEVQEYKSAKGVVDLSEQGKMFLQNVGENDRKIADINIQLAVLDKVEKYVISKNSTAGIVPATLGVNDPVLSQLLQKLYESEIQYQKLRLTTAENNPILISLRGEIESIRPSVLENIQNQRVSLQASKTNLASTNSAYNAVLQTIPKKERELLEVSRQHLIKSNVYNFLLQKREETALSYAPTAGDSRIVDMAESSVFPVSPKKPIVLLVSFALSFLIGAGFVIGKELLNSKLLFRSEIEAYTQAPIVAEISFSKTKTALAITSPDNLFIAEQFRQLRSAIGLYNSNSSRRKILITSSISGEGKSFISNNLALSLALSGKRVVLLDLDLRRPRTSEVFEMRDNIGIAEYLEDSADPEDILFKTEYSNLYLIPSGSAHTNPTELLLNGKLRGLFSQLEASFDYVIFDTSPVDPVTDAHVLTSLCDLTLFVIRHNYTPKAIVQQLDSNIKVKALKNVALVFNGVKSRGFLKKGYGYNHGYGYENIYRDSTYKTSLSKKRA